MKNKLTDLNDHLFAQLERLGDEDMTLISRAELQYLNRWLGYDDAPAEVRPTLINLARVECKRFQLEKAS